LYLCLNTKRVVSYLPCTIGLVLVPWLSLSHVSSFAFLSSSLAINKKYPGLYKVHTKASTACCVECFRNELMPLTGCVVSLLGNNNSNCKQHMVSKHKEDLWGKQYKVDTEGTGNTGASLSSKKKAGSGSVAHSLGEPSPSGCFFSRTNKVPQMIVQRGNDLQLQFMRSCNVAACHANSPELKNFLEHIVDNTHFYSRNKSSMVMGRHKVSNQRYKSFNQLVQVVKSMVDKTRNWLQEQTMAKKIPFLTVGHDGWDSKDKDMLGVCVHFTDIEQSKRRTIALGLQQSHSKKSKDIAEHTLKILERYVADLFCICLLAILSLTSPYC
jgi:hypothetical protein